mmetsp:Transcript_22353/g.38035  ORF Transcript_22353/g.38035 Transcript_22353/m.38035 type:complete len:116 (-) Transcript_22353:928-1275(-)
MADFGNLPMIFIANGTKYVCNREFGTNWNPVDGGGGYENNALVMAGSNFSVKQGVRDVSIQSSTHSDALLDSFQVNSGTTHGIVDAVAVGEVPHGVAMIIEQCYVVPPGLGVPYR